MCVCVCVCDLLANIVHGSQKYLDIYLAIQRIPTPM